MKQLGILRFVYYVTNTLWIVGSICFACFLLYYIVFWDWKSLPNNLYILLRIIGLTIVSYIIKNYINIQLNRFNDSSTLVEGDLSITYQSKKGNSDAK